MKNALTFDVEEYFHAEAFARVLRPAEWPSLESRGVATTQRILDVLDRERVRATFFVLGWVAERQPSLVREIASLGHEVGCHGFGHEMIPRLTRDEFERDVTRAKAALEDATGRPVIGYRAPTFSVMRDTLWSLDVLCEAGFRYDSSIFPIVHDRYGIPDAPRFPHRMKAPSGAELAEFPMSTVLVLGRRVPVAGGGYFRLFPYSLTRRAITRINVREGQPAMIYLHPWEIDPDQPRLPVGPLTRFRHLVNVSKTEARLGRILADFTCVPAAEVLAESGLLAIGDLK
jgi:polysaccharide deacetylase family protein (PEP-CTERM system associated)